MAAMRGTALGDVSVWLVSVSASTCVHARPRARNGRQAARPARGRRRVSAALILKEVCPASLAFTRFGSGINV